MSIKLAIWAVLGLLLWLPSSAQPAPKEREGRESPPILSEQIAFSYKAIDANGDPMDYALRKLAETVFGQTGKLMTIEELNPLKESGHVPSIGKATCSLLAWLILLKRYDATLEWISSDNTVHLMLPSSVMYPNVLDQPLLQDCSGKRTLEDWENVILYQYPFSQFPGTHFSFNNNGRGMRALSPDDRQYTRDWQIYKFIYTAKKGVTLRTYLTGLASAYGRAYWIADLYKQPTPPEYYFTPNYVSFIRVRPLPAQVPSPAP